MAAGDIVVIRAEAGGRKGNYFDGTDDYVLHDAQAVARVAAGDTTGTFSAWIYLDTITGTQTILSVGDNNNVNEGIHFDNVGGKLRIFLHNGAATTQFDVIETTAGLTARTWTHVAVVQNGTRPALYVNGVASAMTDTTGLDLAAWYADIGVGPCDKFAIGVTETNATHLNDFKGAIGQVKYWSMALEPIEVKNDYTGATQSRATLLNAALQFNITMTDDGTTDSGLGADNGTLTGDAYYGGHISDWSYSINSYASVTGHAAEFINTFIDGTKYVSIVKKGD